MGRWEMNLRTTTVQFCMGVLLFSASSSTDTLKIDFTQNGGPVETGFQGYCADHESTDTFTYQYCTAFDTKIMVMSVWLNEPAKEAMQRIQRTSGSDLIIDWVGTMHVLC